MNRRSFLTMLGSSILALLLPKGNSADEQERIAEFLTSRECSGSEEWSLCEPCTEWTFDPVESLVEPYPTLVEALEEIRRICLDQSRWRGPREYTYTMILSSEQFDWYYENVPWFASAVERSDAS